MATIVSASASESEPVRPSRVSTMATPARLPGTLLTA